MTVTGFYGLPVNRSIVAHCSLISLDTNFYTRPHHRCPAAIMACRVKREAGQMPALPPQR